MRIIALIPIFNGAPTIDKTIQSMYDSVNEIHIYDGAYEQFPHRNYLSTDGTIEIVKKYDKVRVFYPPNRAPWKDQMTKRTAMFGSLVEGDFALLMDDDEELVNPIKTTDWNFDVGYIWTKSELYDRPYRTPRLFRYMPGMYYKGRHSWLYDKDGFLIASHQHKTDRYKHRDLDVSIYNWRRKDRNRDKKVYRFRRQEERQIKESLKERLIPIAERADKPRTETLTIKEPNKPQYSLIVPFSRPWAVARWFQHFNKVQLPKSTEIIVVADNDAAARLIHRYLLQALVRSKYNGIKLYRAGRQKLNEYAGSGARRSRIISNMHIFQTEAQGQVILGAEDDTLPDYDAYPKLLKIMEKQKAGFVQGTELGRWRNPIVPHWTITEDRIETAEYKGQDIVEINGGGWYCFVTPADVFRRPNLRWTVEPPMGPDLCFVYDLTTMGYKCLGDWSTNCIHFTEDKDLDPRTMPKIAKLFWYKKRGNWIQAGGRIPVRGRA